MGETRLRVPSSRVRSTSANSSSWSVPPPRAASPPSSASAPISREREGGESSATRASASSRSGFGYRGGKGGWPLVPWGRGGWVKVPWGRGGWVRCVCVCVWNCLQTASLTRSSLVVLTRVRSRCCVPPAASRDPPARPASSSGRAPRSCRTRREVDGCGSHVTRIWSGSSLGRAAPQPNDGGAEAARGESRRRADCPTSGQAPHAPGVCTEDMLARGRGIAARGARETAGRGCSAARPSRTQKRKTCDQARSYSDDVKQSKNLDISRDALFGLRFKWTNRERDWWAATDGRHRGERAGNVK